jgi:hypothetical protein
VRQSDEETASRIGVCFMNCHASLVRGLQNAVKAGFSRIYKIGFCPISFSSNTFIAALFQKVSKNIVSFHRVGVTF